MMIVKFQDISPPLSLIEFIRAVNEQTEAALCIANDGDSVHPIVEEFRKRGYSVSRDWKHAVNELSDCRMVALVAETVSKELYELFSQYNSRTGMVQIFDRVSFSLLSIHLPVAFSRFVVVITNTALTDAKDSLLPHAGLIFRGAVP